MQQWNIILNPEKQKQLGIFGLGSHYSLNLQWWSGVACVFCRFCLDPRKEFNKTSMENATEITNIPAEFPHQQNSTGDTQQRNLQFLKLLDIANNIRIYTSMSIIPIGLLLNLLTVVLFLKIRIHKTATGLHLLCLAVSEFFLLLGLGMSVPWPLRIKHFHVSFCMIMNFFISSQQTWAGFLLVSMTIERYLSIIFPLKVNSWNLKRVSKVSFLVFAILLFLAVFWETSLLLGGLWTEELSCVKIIYWFLKYIHLHSSRVWLVPNSNICFHCSDCSPTVQAEKIQKYNDSRKSGQ